MNRKVIEVEEAIVTKQDIALLTDRIDLLERLLKPEDKWEKRFQCLKDCVIEVAEAAKNFPPFVIYDTHGFFKCIACSQTSPFLLTEGQLIPSTDPFPHADDCCGVAFKNALGGAYEILDSQSGSSGTD